MLPRFTLRSVWGPDSNVAPSCVAAVRRSVRNANPTPWGVYTKPGPGLRGSPPPSPLVSRTVPPVTLRFARSRPLIPLGLRLRAQLQRPTQQMFQFQTLARRKGAGLAGGQLPQRDWTKAHADETLHLVAQCLTEATDFAIAALRDRQLELPEPIPQRASLDRPCGIALSCRSQSGRCRQLLRTWPRCRFRPRRQ